MILDSESWMNMRSAPRPTGPLCCRCPSSRIWSPTSTCAGPACDCLPDPAAIRAPDLVERRFRVEAPNLLLVADFTYVRLVTGAFCYTAFVIDPFAGLIVGWECSTSKHTAFAQRAIAQAAALCACEGKPLQNKTIHDSDAPSPRPDSAYLAALHRDSATARPQPVDRDRRDAYDTR
jgi:hypothetical protein